MMPAMSAAHRNDKQPGSSAHLQASIYLAAPPSITTLNATPSTLHHPPSTLITHREEVWHALLCLLEQVLQVKQDALTALPAVHKGGGYACLAATTLRV